MTTIVKIDRVTREVIPGEPQAGDFVRITNGSSISEHEFTPEPEPVTPVPRWDAYDFKLRFTPDERVAIRTAGATNGYVADFIDMLDTAAMTGTRIHADDALVALGFYVLETMDVISAERGAVILGAAT